MRPLLEAEILRFRTAALAGAAAHAAILGAIGTFGDLFTASGESVVLGIVCYALLGLLLGVYQVGSYRRLGAFSYLIHRPLAPARILLALTGAAAVLLSFVALLPLLVAAVIFPTDTRNLLVAPLVLGICLAFYLIGVFLVLNPSRARFAALLVPGVLLLGDVSTGGAFLTIGGVLLWLWILAAAAFKPDLSTHLDRPLPISALALPTQLVLLKGLSLALVFIYSLGVAASEVGWRNIPAFGWNDHFPEDTLHRLEYLSGGEALASALRRAGLNPQFDANAAFELSPGHREPQRRGQLMIHDRGHTFNDQARSLRFTFSHDLMLFTGRVRRTGQAAGWLGPGGYAEGELPRIRFEEVPEVVDGHHLVSLRRVYSVSGRLAVAPVFEAPANEAIVAVVFPEAGIEPAAVLTDRALHILAPRRLAIPFEGDVRNLSRAIVAPREGELLVLFIFGAESDQDGAPASQTLGLVDRAGHYRKVAEMPLRQGPPAWMRHRSVLLAPALAFATEAALRRPLPNPSLAVVLGAVLLSLISAALTGFVARRRRLASGWAWSLAALLAGLPGFLTFLLLTPRAEPPRMPLGR